MSVFNDFLSSMSTIPATDEQLFGHERYLNKSLAQHVFAGQYVYLQDDRLCNGVPADEAPKKVRVQVEMICSDEVLVNFESKNRTSLFVSLNQLTLDSYEISDELKNILEKDRSLLLKTLMEFIKVGDVFELQEKDSLVLHTVQILSTHNGFVKVVDERGVCEMIHITNVRCHPVGWSNTPMARENGYVLMENPMLNKPITAAPTWLFEYATLKEHNFWPGMLLEALDPENRMMFYPAIVTDRHNSHYFSVRLVRELTCDSKLKHSPKISMCHLGSTDIFPMGWCSKNGIRLSFPKGLEDYSLMNLWEGLRAKLQNLKIDVKEVPSFVTEGFLEQPKLIGKIMTPRYCEFLDHWDDNGNPVLLPAVILRSTKHLIWIGVDSEDKITPPMIFSYLSDRLFRWGFSDKVDWTLVLNRTVLTSIEREPKYTSQPTSIFQNQKKSFMSEVWLNDRLWLQRVHVNKSCFCGPFLDAEKVKRLCNSFDPGPLPGQIVKIITDLLHCSNRVAQVIEILQANKNTVLPTLPISLRRIHRRNRFQVEVCQQTFEFSGWMQNVLRKLDACPHLLSLEEVKDDGCIARCSTLAALPYMNFENHPNTHTQFFNPKLLNQQQKRRQNRNVLSGATALNITLAEATPTIAKRISAPTRSGTSSHDEDEEEEEINNLSSPNFAQNAVESAVVHNHLASCVLSSQAVCDNGGLRQSSQTVCDNGILDALATTEMPYDLNDIPTLRPMQMLTRSMTSGKQRNGTAVAVKKEVAPQKSSSNGRRNRNTTVKPTNAGLKSEAPNVSRDENGNGFISVEPPSRADFAPMPANEEMCTPSKDLKNRPSLNGAPLWKTTTSPPSPPPKRLKYCHPAINSNPVNWTCEELCQWITEADPKLKDIAKQLADEEVDFDAIMMFKHSTFADLGIKLGPAVKILALVDELRKFAIKSIEKQ